MSGEISGFKALLGDSKRVAPYLLNFSFLGVRKCTSEVNTSFKGVVSQFAVSKNSVEIIVACTNLWSVICEYNLQ